MNITPIGLNVCGKTGIYHVRIDEWSNLLGRGYKNPLTTLSPEFTISGHIWQLKFWLCPDHLHFELIKKTESPLDFYFKLKIFPCVVEQTNDIVLESKRTCEGID